MFSHRRGALRNINIRYAPFFQRRKDGRLVGLVPVFAAGKQSAVREYIGHALVAVIRCQIVQHLLQCAGHGRFIVGSGKAIGQGTHRGVVPGIIHAALQQDVVCLCKRCGVCHHRADAATGAAVYLIGNIRGQRCAVHCFIGQGHAVLVCNTFAVAACAALAVSDAVACNVQRFSRQRADNLTIDVKHFHFTTPSRCNRSPCRHSAGLYTPCTDTTYQTRTAAFCCRPRSAPHRSGRSGAHL